MANRQKTKRFFYEKVFKMSTKNFITLNKQHSYLEPTPLTFT